MARLTALEGVGNPVCVVTWPGDAPALWIGVYGTAKVHRGEPQAITSDGKRHAL